MAQIQGVAVLNVNDLANTLKAVVMPGESLAVRVIARGRKRIKASPIWTTAPWWSWRAGARMGEKWRWR